MKSSTFKVSSSARMQDWESENAKMNCMLAMQESILYWFIEDKAFRTEHFDTLQKHQVFIQPHIKNLFTIIVAEISKGYMPSRDDLRVLLEAPSRYGISNDSLATENALAFLGIGADRFLSLELVSGHLNDHIREQAGLETAEAVVKAVKGNTPRQIVETLRTTLDVLETLDKKPQDLATIDYDSLVESVADSKRRVSTGMVHPDCAMGGGLARGEFMTVVGRTKTGKSHFLVNQMYANVLKGHNVLYLSFENGMMDIQRRFLSRASGLYYSQMRRVPDHQKQNRIEEIRERTSYLDRYGKYLILHRPPNSLTYRDLPSMMHRMEVMVGARPDLIIIDYADYLNIIPSAGQRIESYDKHERVYYELAAFAQENDIAISTVTQVNRDVTAKKQKENGLIEIENVAKSSGKVNASDYAFALNPLPRQTHYQYGYFQCLAGRSTPIQEFLFPYRSLLGMSYYESLNVYDDNPQKAVYFPTDLYLSNDRNVIADLKLGFDEDMRAFAELLKPPLIEEQEEKERKMCWVLNPNC